MPTAFIKHVRTVTKGCRHPKYTLAALEANGFRTIGQGAFKKVYRSEQYPDWVVKVFHRRTQWYWDHSTCGIIPKMIQEFWLKNVFVCRRYVIQPYANGLGGTEKDANDWFKKRFNGKEYPRFDIYVNNTRYHNYKPVIVDFTDRKGKNHPKYRWPRLEPLEGA